MGKAFVHPGDVEIPDWRAGHDEDAGDGSEGEVEGGVGLLHEAELFGLGGYVVVESEGVEEQLHGCFAGEG